MSSCDIATNKKVGEICESVNEASCKTAANTPTVLPTKSLANTEVTEVSKQSSTKTDGSLAVNRFYLKPEQSYKKETKASRLGKSTGRWTQQEHVLFIEGLKIYGKNWKKVESYIGTRTGTQIRSHAQKFFNRIKKEYSTEDPSKFVLENMSDETIKRIVLEHCGEDIPNEPQEKDFPEDTPEVLFLITKGKSSKKSSEPSSPVSQSTNAYKSAFKRFKRDEEPVADAPEDSKLTSDTKTDVNPQSTLVRPTPVMAPNITHLLSQAVHFNPIPTSMLANQSLNQTAMLMNMLLNLNQNAGIQ